MKRIASIIILLLAAVSALADPGDLAVGDYSVWSDVNSSYWTLGSIGPYRNAAMAMYFNTNHMRFWGDNRSGGSIQDALIRLHKYALPQQAQVGPNGFNFIHYCSDNNGGNDTNLFCTNIVTMFAAPGILWDGTAYSVPGGIASSQSNKWKFIIGGSIPTGANTQSHFIDNGPDALLNNFATNTLTYSPGPIMTFDIFHALNNYANFTNDILHETHLREVSKNIPIDDEHLGTSGAFAFAVNELDHFINTNIWTSRIAWSNGVVISTNHCVILSATKSGGSLTIVQHSDRHSMAFDMPDVGKTNDCSNAFVLQPAYSNAFYEDMVVPDMPDGSYQITEDGEVIANTTGVVLRGGFNWFSVTKGAIWRQRRAVLDIYRTRYGYDTNSIVASNGGTAFGEQVFQSNADADWNAGDRGNTLISALQGIINTIQIQDTNAWAAATPTNHTFVITQITSVLNSSNVTLPSSAQYHAEINDTPDNGSTWNVNPPVFSWLYYETPATFWTNSSSYQQPRLFRYELTTNGNFGNLYEDLITPINYYNFQWPVTNADGSNWTGTNFWRVVYMDFSSNAVGTGAVHTFFMAPSAQKWDRSIMVNSNYMMSVTTNHPHLMFNLANRDLVSSNVQHRTWVLPGVSWSSITNDSYNYLTNTWWNSDSVTNQGGWAQFALDFAEVGFTYQLTTNVVMSNALPGVMLEIYCTNLVKYGYDRTYPYALNSNVPQYIGLAYDWLYTLMTTQERSNVLNCMESMAQYYVDENWLYTGTAPNTNRVYTNALLVKFGSQFREGESHSRNDQVGVTITLAGYGESSILRNLNPYFLSYYFVQFDPFQGDDGRAYDIAQNFKVNRQFGPALTIADSFPSWGLTNVPVYNYLANEFLFYEPVGYALHSGELEPYCFGVAGGAMQPWQGMWNWTRMYDAACFLNRGDLMRRFDRGWTNNGMTREEPLLEVFNPFYYPPPAEADASTNAFLDLTHGWAIAFQKLPTDWDCFTNGIGFLMQGRGQGGGRMNATYSDGQVEMFAYGAHVTEGGSGNYEEHTLFQNNPLFVDGVGLNATNPPMIDPILAPITMFTNSSDFAAATVNLTKDYNLYAPTTGGYQDIETRFYSTNGRSYITNVSRTVLSPHHRYFVTWDSLQTTTNAHFQWVWHIWQTNATINTNGCAFTYTATNTVNGSNVTIYVSPIINPSEMTLTDLFSPNLRGTNSDAITGTNYAKYNPITGENYNLPAWDQYYPDQYWPYWAHNIWIQNATATNNWRFGFVEYPLRWDDTNVPVFTRINDNTIQVVQGTNNDVISFDYTNASPQSTYVVLTGNVSTNQPSSGPYVLYAPFLMR